MTSSVRQYRLLGRSFDQEGLESICLEKISVLATPQWERDIWSFILGWFSTEKTVEVTTSGSTGTPKSMLLEKRDMVESAKATLAFFKLEQGDTVLLCVPVKFIAGKMMIVRALEAGLDLHFIEPVSDLDLSKLGEIRFSAMTPMQVAKIIEVPQGKKRLEKINTLIVGGSALPSGLNEKLQTLNVAVWQTYGMTETITHIALRKVNGKNASEWYQPLPGISVQVDNSSRLIIDYPKIGIDQLLTNDIAEIHSNGRFKIIGRADNVVNSGGVKLYPELIEQKLEGLLDCEFYLTGLPDSILGERLVMFVEGVEINEKDTSFLSSKIENRLSGFEMPKEIMFKLKFKRTSNGKIIRSRSL